MPGQILVVDPDRKNRIILRSRVGLSCHSVAQAETAADAVRVLVRSMPDLVLLGPGLDPQDACALTERLRGLVAALRLPVLLLVDTPQRALLHAALAAGADDVIETARQGDFLMARIRGLMRQRSVLEELLSRSLTERQLGLAEADLAFRTPGRIALVARNASVARSWAAAMAPCCTHELRCFTHAEALRSSARGTAPDLFAIEDRPERPDEVLRLIADLRSHLDDRHAHLILVARNTDPEAPAPDLGHRLAMALDIGAHDILRNGFDPVELSLRADLQVARKQHIDGLRNRVREGLREAVRDPLTGLYNRRYALPHMERMVQRCARRGQSVVAMMVDVDRFKRVNDRWGHRAGDTVLREVAARLRDNIRAQDLIARIGGEEFLIAMPDMALAQAKAVAARLCALVGSQPVEALPGTSPIAVTVSIGIARWTPDAADTMRIGGLPDDLVGNLIDRADAALYRAKEGGRNTVTTNDTAAA